MNLTDLPTRFPEPFANSAGPTYTAPVPTLSTGLPAGRASLDLGFPPETFLPVGAGGTPPFGQDFNGLLQQVTANDRWTNAGGPPIYNAAFQTAIGGYPQGATVKGAVNPLSKWTSFVDANTTNPETGGAGWYGGALINANGWRMDENGILEQWGSGGSIPLSSHADYVFPRAFPTAVWNVAATTILNADSAAQQGIGISGAPSLTGFRAYNTSTTGPIAIYWRALGN